MGDPTFTVGQAFNVGSSRRNGVFAHRDTAALQAVGDKIQSYCDQGDTFCASKYSPSAVNEASAYLSERGGLTFLRAFLFFFPRFPGAHARRRQLPRHSPRLRPRVWHRRRQLYRSEGRHCLNSFLRSLSLAPPLLMLLFPLYFPFSTSLSQPRPGGERMDARKGGGDLQ